MNGLGGVAKSNRVRLPQGWSYLVYTTTREQQHGRWSAVKNNCQSNDGQKSQARCSTGPMMAAGAIDPCGLVHETARGEAQWGTAAKGDWGA